MLVGKFFAFLFAVGKNTKLINKPIKMPYKPNKVLKDNKILKLKAINNKFDINTIFNIFLTV